MVSKVKQAKELFSGVSARDVAIVGGISGAIGLGAYGIYLLTGQATVDTYTKQIGIIDKDIIDELHDFVVKNGTGGLTPTQTDAINAKLKLRKQASDAAAAAAATGQFPFIRIIEGGVFIVTVYLGLKFGPSALKGFLDAVRSRGNPSTGQGMYQLFEGAEAVGLAANGNVPLATAFYNTTMASDSLVAVTSLQLEQATLQAEITNLSGLALITAQIELASIANDILLIPPIYTFVPPFI